MTIDLNIAVIFFQFCSHYYNTFFFLFSDSLNFDIFVNYYKSLLL